MSSFNNLKSLIVKWAEDREIFITATTQSQMLKTTEEIGELASAVARGSYEDLIDAYGDVLVTLIIGAEIADIDLEAALATAYMEIKDRKGKMVHGVFVKEG